MNVPLLPALLCSYLLYRCITKVPENDVSPKTLFYRPSYTIPKNDDFSQEDIAKFLQENSFATLITVATTEHSSSPLVFTSFLPVMFDENRKHVLLFHGPHCYISPTWYLGFRERNNSLSSATEAYVPTWNYSLIKITSKNCTLLQDSNSKYALVNELSQFHEEYRQENLDSSSSFKYSLDKEPSEEVELELRGITGLEFSVDKVEVKMKMSQNKTTESRSLLVSVLNSLPFDSFKKVGEMMNKLTKK